jgi:hypothetical protein
MNDQRFALCYTPKNGLLKNSSWTCEMGYFNILEADRRERQLNNRNGKIDYITTIYPYKIKYFLWLRLKYHLTTIDIAHVNLTTRPFFSRNNKDENNKSE